RPARRGDPPDHGHAEPRPRDQPLPVRRSAELHPPLPRAGRRRRHGRCLHHAGAAARGPALPRRGRLSRPVDGLAADLRGPRQGARLAQHPVPDGLAARPADDEHRPFRLHRLHRRAASPERSHGRHAGAGQRAAQRRRHGHHALRRIWPQRRLSLAGDAAEPGAPVDGDRGPAGDGQAPDPLPADDQPVPPQPLSQRPCDRRRRGPLRPAAAQLRPRLHGAADRQDGRVLRPARCRLPRAGALRALDLHERSATARRGGGFVARPAHEGEDPEEDQRHDRADAGQRHQDGAEAGPAGQAGFLDDAPGHPGREHGADQREGAGQPEQAREGRDFHPEHLSPRPGFARGPGAERQHAHDDEGADDRHQMKQRQRARETRARADPPGRDDQHERQQQVYDQQEEHREGAQRQEPAHRIHDVRPGRRLRSRP
ncbi:hypothetical protein OSTOST_13197, partial [Ostertagia ostertagi]